MRIKNKLNSNRGFTIIEISIVIIISGVLLATFLRGYSLYTFDRDSRITVEHAEFLQIALNEFMDEYGRYPCPADPTLDPSDDDYGIETICGPLELSPTSEDCDSDARPILTEEFTNTGTRTQSNVICAQNLARDVNGDGTSENILVGIIPFRTLTQQAALGAITEYREYMSFDGYDMRFTYAVTEIMADIGRDGDPSLAVTPNMGAIKVVDENSIDVTIPNDSAHYVLVSHGRDRRGAYNAFGDQLGASCVITTVPSFDNNGVDDPFSFLGSGLDLQLENCDHFIDPDASNVDAVFRKAIRSDSEGREEFFDDLVYYTSSYSTNLWQSALNSSDFSGQSFLYNTNIGNVGVGNAFSNPTSKMHVAGDLVIVDDDPSAATVVPIVNADGGFCDSDNRPINSPPTGVAPDLSECMQVSSIVETNTACPAGEIAVGFDRGGLLCEPLFSATAPTIDDTNNCGPDTLDLDGDSNTTEPMFVTSLVYNRATNTITVSDCAPL